MSVFSLMAAEDEAAAVPTGARRGDGWVQAVERWRCGRRVVVMERPAVGVSWALAVAGSCLAVGVAGMVRPIERVATVPAVAVAIVPEEWPMFEVAGAVEALGEERETGEVAEVEAGAEEFPEVAVALTADDVFAVPEAVPVEPMLRAERVEWQSAPRPASRPTATRKPAVSGGGAAARAGTGRPTGSAQGTGEGGTGGGTAGARRGRTAGHFPTPPYPSQARSRGQQGTVQLLIVFGADGRVTSASVSRSSGFSDLDRAAAAWVRRHWRAATGQVGSFRLPVQFQLR